MRSDYEYCNRIGINFMRIHIKSEIPRALYWADKLGLLVSSEMANAYVFDERYVDRFTREWIEALERDYNHPSIIIWAPINESWGVPNLREARQQQSPIRAYDHLVRLDHENITYVAADDLDHGFDDPWRADRPRYELVPAKVWLQGNICARADIPLPVSQLHRPGDVLRHPHRTRLHHRHRCRRAIWTTHSAAPLLHLA